MNATITTQAEMHRRRCREECQQDVIFLLRIRRFSIGILPSGYDYSDEHEGIVDAQGQLVTEQDMINEGFAFEWWDVDSVWLDRAEAEAFAESKAYNYGEKNKGWQVYGVSARGALATLLKGGTP